MSAGLIAAVVIESLLLAGIIGYVIYTRFVNTPEKRAADQQMGAMQSQNRGYSQGGGGYAQGGGGGGYAQGGGGYAQGGGGYAQGGGGYPQGGGGGYPQGGGGYYGR